MACIALLGRHRSDHLGAGLRRLADALTEHGHTVRWEHNTAIMAERENEGTTLLDMTGVDLMISYGGDGTVLSAARRAAPYKVPVLAIHKGNLGFLADFMDDDLPSLLEAIDQPKVESRLMLQGELWRDGKLLKTGIVLNDVVVARAMSVTLIELELLINGRTVCTERADGFLISTPVGSTAYNLAAGGPIMLPELDVMALSAICPQRLSNKPVVVSGRSEVIIRVIKCQDSSLHFDGQSQGMIQAGDEVRVAAAKNPCLLVISPARDRFQMLREKLGWNA